MDLWTRLFETELTKRREKKRSDALEKMRTIAEEIGMTPDELLGCFLPVLDVDEVVVDAAR